MPRQILPQAQLHPAIQAKVTGYHSQVVQAVQAACAQHAVVIVGMRQNPFPKRARKALDAAAQPYHYMEYGSYWGQWQERLALKIWTGWPTIPMVFIQGMLVGGADDLIRLIEAGELADLLVKPTQA